MTVTGLRLNRLFPTAGALTVMAFAGCASSTVINSQPSGARVLVNGMPAGTTPYTLSDTKIVGATTQVRLEYPGYQTYDTVISRSEELDVGALVGGLFLLVPFLWIMKYKPSRTFELSPAGSAQPAPSPGTPAPAPRPAAPAQQPGPVGPAGYPVPPPGYPPPAR